jgi:hypothetical protein
MVDIGYRFVDVVGSSPALFNPHVLFDIADADAVSVADFDASSAAIVAVALPPVIGA